MKAFTETKTTKEQVIANLERHYRLDQFIQGRYWEDGKGCAVGCSLVDLGEEPDDHNAYERQFGIPEELARLEDTIFEGLTKEESKEWPLRFMNAITPGADLSDVSRKFKIRLLEECLVFDRDKYKDVADAVALVIDALEGNGDLDKARSAAWSAARSAGRSAGRSAASAAWSARSAARSAGRSAGRSAARAAAWSAAWAAAWSAAWSEAWSAAYSKIATILIEELQKAGVESA